FHRRAGRPGARSTRPRRAGAAGLRPGLLRQGFALRLQGRRAMTGDLYSWLKALHVISIIAWMAGMLYLPRLFVYHCAAAPGSAQSETFKVMERRLLRAIINPAMTAAWIF